jgi:hypothetical protein
MFLEFKKYNILILLTIVMLVAVSCRKGSNPEPLLETQESSIEGTITTGDEGPRFKDEGEVVGGDDGEDDDGVNVLGGEDDEVGEGSKVKSVMPESGGGSASDGGFLDIKR